MKQWLQALGMTLLLGLTVASAEAAPIWLLDIRDAIGPATADHVGRGLAAAEEAGAPLVILRMDTPGGLDKSMRQIVKAILKSRVPVAGYVAPGGARAASAGTYILYASHIAAMAPATNIGAATPVQIGAPGMPGAPEPEPKGKDKSPAAGTAMERKIINDAVAYMQGLAELRGRNSEWAQQAVREGASLAAEEALKLAVIDLLATSVNDLLRQLDGREVNINGASVTLATADAEVYVHAADWRSEFLSVITDPNVAYILLLLGIYGLIFEFSNPGMGVPGIVGAICILLALYAFQVLPISYAGLGLILLGIGLMVAEAFAPSFGVLGLGGVIAFVIGSIILMDTDLPGYQIAWPIIVAFTSFSALLMLVVLGLVVKARRRAVVTGLPHLIGCEASVESVRDGIAYIRLEGELWQVFSETALSPRDRVRVNAATGVTLNVSKVADNAADKPQGESP